MTGLLIVGLAGAALFAVGCDTSMQTARTTEPKTPAAATTSARSTSELADPASAGTISLPATSKRASPPPASDHVPSKSPPRSTEPHAKPALQSHPRNRLIGPGLNVGVSTYSDCTGRAALTRRTVAIDTCMTWDVYFVEHSYGGPLTGLTHASDGETLTWYNAAGVARRYTIEGHQYGYAYGPADLPPPGTAAQFQTCLTRNGSRTITFYAASP